MVLLGFDSVVLGLSELETDCTGFYWVLLAFDRVVLGFTEFYWLLNGSIRSHWIKATWKRIVLGF